MVDVVTMGEAMIRLAPPDHIRLEQATQINMGVGGAEYNVAVALSRFGLRSAWISRLTNNPLGKLIANKAREQGVDLSRVIWTEEDRVGIYFLEYGAVPRATQVIYDRKNSAVSKINPEEVDWEFVKSAKLVHLTGITPALSSNCSEWTLRAIEEAKSAKVIVSFDVNYRARLWSPEPAKEFFDKILSRVDILILTKQDAQRVFGLEGSVEESLKWLKEKYGNEVVAITLPEGGSVAYSDKFYYGMARELQEVDRVGAGDAYAAGFIYGYLTGDIGRAIAYADATASLKHSIYGDLCFLDLKEVEDLIGGTKTGIQR